MSIRLRETVKKIRRNLSLRSSREDVRAEEQTRTSIQDIGWSRHAGGPLSHAAWSDAPLASGTGLRGTTSVSFAAPSKHGMPANNGCPSGLPSAAATCLDSRPAGDLGRTAAADSGDNSNEQQQLQQQQQARAVELVRAAGGGGFGFVAGGQRPTTVRTVDAGGPSDGLLLPGDQIFEVNGVDATSLEQSRVFELIRNAGDVIALSVRHAPQPSSTRSILRSSSDDGKKLKKSPSRVRFSEAVEEVDGDGHLEPTAYSTGGSWPEPMAQTLKVYLENRQTRSFQFDDYVTAEDVKQLLLQKLEITATEHFGLVMGELGCTDISRFRALPPEEIIAETLSTETRCSLRILYAPKDPYDLLRQDPLAFDYLYKQCCNDLVDERLVLDPSSSAVALRLVSLYMLEHALVHDIPPNKVTAKKVDKEFGLRSFLAPGLVSSMQPKVLHRKLDGYLKLNRGLAAPGQKRVTALQARMHYMQITAGLPTFCGRRFATRSYEGQRLVDMLLLVGPNCGISRLVDALNDSFQKIVSLEDVADLKICEQPGEEYEGIWMKRVELRSTHNTEVTCLYMKDASAYDFCAFVDGYRAILTGKAVSNSPSLRQPSRECLTSAADVSSILSCSEGEELIVPPVDYDEATTDSDGEAGENAHAVNSILLEAFDDLDDGLLGADSTEDHNEPTARLTSGSKLAGDSSSNPSKSQLLLDVQTDRPQLVGSAPDTPSVALLCGSAGSTNAIKSTAIGGSGKNTRQEEEIGIQMSALDAGISRDSCCGLGEDESGIDSDSEDSGNETLNSVDTTSSYMTGDSQLSQSWPSEPGNRSLDRSVFHNSPNLAKVFSPASGTLALQQHDSESEDPRVCTSEGVHGLAANAEGIMMALDADASDVSTEEDDDDNGVAVVGRAEQAASACPKSNNAAIVTTSNGDSPGLIHSMSDSTQSSGLTSAVNRRSQGRATPADQVATHAAVSQRSLVQRPFSDGILLGDSPSMSVLCSSEVKIKEAGKFLSKLVRQDATFTNELPAEPPPTMAVLDRGRLKGQNIRRSATVASSSKLAQAFAKLSSSGSSGSHDFCPATSPRQRSISAPFNVSSTAQGVLARSTPVRAPLLAGSFQSPAPSEAGLPTSMFRLPRPSSPPPPPPPSSAVRDSVDHTSPYPVSEAESGSQRRAPELLASRSGPAESPPCSDKLLQKSGVRSALPPTDDPPQAQALASKRRPQRVLSVGYSVDDLQRSQSASWQSSPRDTTAVSARHIVRSSSSTQLSTAVEETGSVSYSVGGQLDGREASREATGDGSAVVSSKSRVFARILDALRPRKKSASLSRAASAIELVPRADSNKLSLPRPKSGAYRQRPTIFLKMQEVTLLRATSVVDFADGGGDGVDGDGAVTGSPEAAQPSSKFVTLPAAEVCTIDTTTRAPKEAWSKMYDLETFRPPSPTAGKEPAAGLHHHALLAASPRISLLPEPVDNADVTVPSADFEAANARVAMPRCPPEDPVDANWPNFSRGNINSHKASSCFELPPTLAERPTESAVSSEESEASPKEERERGMVDALVGADSAATAAEPAGDSLSPKEVRTRVLADADAAERAKEATLWTSSSATEAAAAIISSEQHSGWRHMDAVGGVDSRRSAIGSFDLRSAVQSAAIGIVDSESFHVGCDDGEAPQPRLPPPPPPPPPPESEMVCLVPGDSAAAAELRGTTLTDALAAVEEPGDAAGAREAVERLLDVLSQLEEAPQMGEAAAAGPAYAVFVDANPEDVAAATIRRLSSEAQLMVVECKQMVAAIARRQRYEAAATSGAGVAVVGASDSGAAAAEASILRAEERRLVVRSFSTFTRLLGSAVSPTPTLRPDAATTAADGVAADYRVRLGACLLTLGRAYAAALAAACNDTSTRGTSHADGAAPAELAASGDAAAAIETLLVAKPNAEELVRRLMAIATELATALGGLIRLLKAVRESDASQ